jgi:hypothetical protein
MVMTTLLGAPTFMFVIVVPAVPAFTVTCRPALTQAAGR